MYRRILSRPVFFSAFFPRLLQFTSHNVLAVFVVILGVIMSNQHQHHQHHHHHHEEPAGHGHDFVSAKKEYFDKKAGEYDKTPMILDMTEKYAISQYWYPPP